MDKHTRTGLVLAVVFAAVCASILAWANMPTFRTADMGATLAAEPSVTVGEITQVYALAPVYVVATKATKAHKRICDVRGNTHSVGYAVPTETKIANETTAVICWME